MNSKQKIARISIVGALVVIALLFTFTVALAGGDIQPTLFTDNDVIIEGNTSDWDLEADFFADMYRAAQANKPVEAQLFLKYHTPTGTLYVLVLAVDGVEVLVQNDNAFVKINDVKMADGNSPNFSWINQSGGRADGWEASFELSLTSVSSLNVHTNVWSDGEEQTAAVIGRDLQFEAFQYDYGDMIPEYQATSLAEGGPRHFAGPMRLGDKVDGEFDGQPGDIVPSADDENSILFDDEDGVEPIGNWRQTGEAKLQVVVNGCPGPDPCYLNGWVDWGNDFSFSEAFDQVFSDVQVTDGVYELVLDHGGVSLAANFYARFRICQSENLCNQWDLIPNVPSSAPEQSGLMSLAAPMGVTAEPFGEIEDYYYSFAPTAVRVNNFNASAASADGVTLVIALAAFIPLVWGAVWLHRRNRRMKI